MKKSLLKYFFIFILSTSASIVAQNYSLSFDGSNDYVSIMDDESLTSTSAMTISAWFKKVPGTGWMSLVGKGTSDVDEEYVLMLKDDQVYFDVGQGGGPYLQQSTTIAPETWHYIAAVHTRSGNTSTLKVYLNGEDVGGTTVGALYTPNDNSYPLTIGSRWFSASYGLFQGEIDDVRIWNNALSSQQIQSNMYSNLNGDEEGLVGHWNFNEGEGDALADLSGNGNDGNINGATWSDDVPSLENDSDYSIGSLGPAGGFIIYDKGLVSDGWRYIEIAPDGWYGDGDPTTTWGCSGSEINGADGYALGSGMQNSIDIENSCDGDNAASISLNTEINGYSDWHLPSIDELWLMYQLFFSDNIGNYQNHYYWSSTEFSSIGALFINFGSSEVQYQNIGDTNKQTYTEHFRPIRYFSGEEQIGISGFTYGGEFEGNNYYVSEQQMLWQDANNAAENAGGHLVVISSEEENTFVSNLYNTGDFTEGGETTSRLWLGLVYDNGNFSWVNGEEFNYSNWQPSHPEDGIADNGAYAITNGGDLGKWLLKRPGDNYRFVLEIPDEDSNQNEDVNYSLSFDGINDRVVVPHNPAYDFNDQFTIQGWFNHKSDLNERYIITKGRDISPGSSHRFWGLRSNNDGSLFFEIIMQNSGYNGFQIDPSFTLDTWNHFSLVYDGNSLKFYLNGVESWNSPLSGNLQNGTYDLSIGYFPHSNLNQYGYFFEGGIDDISVWNIALSSDQIQPYLDSELSGQEQGLVGYWNFNEGEGTVVNDLSGNGNIGTIVDGTWIGDSAPIEPPSYGCTDSYALNYDPNAGLDDGSCYFPEDGNFSLSFDGEANAVDIGVSISGDYTVSGWFNYETANTGNAIVGSSSNDYIRLVPDLNDGSQRFLGYNSPTGANHMGQTALEANQWYHFTVTRAGDELTFFINGEFDGSFSEPSTNLDWVKIGIHRNGWQHGFHGNLDNITIWDTHLEQSQIQEVMYTDSTWSNNDLLKANYKFNSNEGNILFDHSGNANHGQINGAAWGDGFILPSASVTFMVNMRDYEGMEFENGDIYDGDLSEGLFLAGGNIGWLADSIDNQTGFQMSDDDGDLVYEVTIDLERNSFYWYKFRIGLTDGNWQGNWESISDCGYGDYSDRYFSTTYESNQTVGPYCFSSCENCEIPNKSLSFDGVDDYVEIPDSEILDGMSQMTIQFYMKWNAYPYQSYGKGVQVLEKWETANSNATGSYSFYTHHDADMLTYMVQTENNQLGVNIDLSANMSLGVWYQVTGVYDGQYSSLYLNGILQGQVEMSGNVASTPFSLELANQGNVNSTFFDGSIDEVIIWDIALSQEQIQSNMYVDLSGNETGLVGYWNFNDGEGSVLNDLSGNGNDGTIFGATWSDDVPQPLHSGPEWYVSEGGSDGNNGSQDYPFASIQFAINSANNGDSIFVNSGTYNEIIDLSGKSIKVIGEERNSTIIDANQQGPGVRFDNPNNPGIYSLIRGFTITNAYRNGDGGGIYVYESDLHMEDLIIENNEAFNGEGGGISIQNSNGSTLSGSIIRNNLSHPRGGGLNVGNSIFNVDNTIITENEIHPTSGVSGASGGGVYIDDNSEINFINVEIIRNKAYDQGGGLFLDRNSVINLNNCTVAHNSAIPDPNIPWGGTLGGNGGAYAAYNNSSVVMHNTIIWGNPAANNQQMSGNSGSTLEITYSNIQGLPGAFSGNGNIDSEPLFCNSPLGNFSLAENSPCIGTGQEGANIGALGVGCTESYSNYSLSFDGNDDQIELDPSFLNGLSEFTFQAMFFSNQEQSGISNIIQHDGPDHDFYLRYESGFFRAVQKHSGSEYGVIDIDSPEPGVWHQITFTYDGSNSKFYLNGEEKGSFGLTGQYIANETIYLGNWDQREGFDGQIDEVSIFNYALTQDEIFEYYGRALSGFEPGLISHFNFNEASGNTLTDITGNGNDGIINGATWGNGAPVEAPVVPDPEIQAINVDVNGNDVSFSLDAIGDFSHFQWRLDWDGPVMSYESVNFEDIRPGLHYVRVALLDENNEMVTDEVLQSFYVLDGLTQHFYTDFEDIDENGLPSGWSSYSNGQGWYVSDDPYFEAWTTEPGVGNVVISNDDSADNDGSNDFNDGSQDYLNTPEIDFTSFGGPVALEFGSYFDGQWGQTAHINYSSDGGNSWNHLVDVGGGNQWERHYVDLTILQNFESVILGFHSNDNGGWAAGWILDDIAIMDVYESTTFENTHAILFDGQGDAIDIGGHGDFYVSDNMVSIVAWVDAPSESEGSKSIFQGWYGYGYQVYLSNGKINAVFREPSGNGVGTMGSTDIRGTGWRHIAVSLNGNNVRIYIDGQLDGVGEFNNTISGNGSDNLSIGYSPWAENESFVGSIDELAVYKRHFSRQDVENLIYNGVGVYGGDSPVAYWNFNNLENNIVPDMTGNGFDGTIMGDPEMIGNIPPDMEEPYDDGNYSIHMYDYCYVDVPGQGLPGGSDAVTLEAWFYRENALQANTEYIISYGALNDAGSMFGMGLQDNNLFASFLGTNYDIASSVSYNLEQWNHFAAVHYGDGAVELFLNGESVYSATVPTPNITAGNLKIGSYPLGGQNWNGYIDEVRVWNIARSQQEIQNSMNSALRGTETGLVGNWAFDENEGNIAHDKTDYENHGTIYNGYNWVDLSAPLDGMPGSITLNVPEQYSSIQEAIDNAYPGDTVLVHPGHYYENIVINKFLILHSFAAAGDLSYIEQTIIDADGSGKPVAVNGGFDGGEINGFTIQNGFEPIDSDNWPANDGGGMIILVSDYIAKNLIVKNNQARWGGGIGVHSPGSYLENITIENNVAEDGAGLFYAQSGHGFAKDIIVKNNNSLNMAGGVYFYNGSNIEMINLTSQGNYGLYGPGISAYAYCHANITNALITDNHSYNTISGVNAYYHSSIALTNATITNNTAEEGDVGLFTGAVSNIFLTNSIFWGQSKNQDSDGEFIFASHSIIDGGHDGNAVMDTDPMFVNDSSDYHLSDGSMGIGFGLNLSTTLSNNVRLRMRDSGDDGLSSDIAIRIENEETNEVVQEFYGSDWGSEITYGPFDLEDGRYMISFDNTNDNHAEETTWEIIADQGWVVRHGSLKHSTGFRIGNAALVGYDIENNMRPDPDGSNPDIGAFESPLGSPAFSPDITLSGRILSLEDGSALLGANIIAVEENNIHNAQTYSDSSGYFSLDVVSGLNYYVNVSLFNYQDQTQYLFINDSSNYIDIYLDIDQEVQDALVEGTLTDWYTNAPLLEASALFAYTNDNGEMETIESVTDENGYFMVQVPGEQDYDLFLYADGYWVEHDAFFLASGENQVLSIGIPPINSAARLYGTVKDIESGDLIPYAEVQLNCDQASDWDHTGDIGTYRVFNYYPGDCDNGVLVVSADGYETSIQSVGGIDFEIGSSSDLDITLMQGNDPDPGMLSGTVYSNIDGNPIMGASISAYNITTSQLFDTSADSGGYFSLELPGSDYSISVNADGHQEFFASIYIEQGNSLDTVFYLDEAYSNMLFGTVYGSDGNSLEGATVTANIGGYYEYSELATVTAVDGSYELTVPNGNFDLSASLTGFTIALVTDVSIENNDQEINFTLEAVEAFDGAVTGTVYFFGNLSGTATINIWNDIYNAETIANDNGSYHLDLLNGTYSIFVTANGYNSIFMPDEIVIENNIVTHDIHFTQPGFVQPPIITSLTDVPDDQGRELDMVWSPGDPEDYDTYTQYSVWRKIDNLPPGTPELYHYISTTEFDESLSFYDRVVPTLRDANIDSAHMSTFIVTAHTDDPYVFFDSPSVMGASIDNLSPAVPSDVSINSTEIGESSYSVGLTWSNPIDEDFAYHNIYRTDISSDDAAFVFQTIESSYTDLVTSWGNYEYWVTAVDHNGNESDPSIIESIELAVEEELLPEEFALGQNYPNPFNPSTQIRYALPEQSKVTIVIYNMLGGKVRTLVNDYQDAGYRNILWNATNDIGAPVSAGMYIYTIQAGSFYQAKKMILLK